MFRIAAVSYLNAKPLVDGLEDATDVELVTDVPARLLDKLISGRADVALCPVIDFQFSPRELVIVPSGGISSDGATLTVRVFSSTPLEDLRHVWVDGDSHTSAALLQVVFAERHGRRLALSTLRSTEETPRAVLLIGDKVVRNEPDLNRYPYQLDLGEEWKSLTGLPFVFAAWMARAGAELGDLPDLLNRRREANSSRIETIATAHARPAGWPDELAREYLQEILSFEVGSRELEAIQLFWSKCHTLGLIESLRPMQLYRNS
ncbi:MAG: menaquinone biosynthetic enzyme MqnA/MqnD family protein [Thermoanaerobaculales bacterium]